MEVKEVIQKTVTLDEEDICVAVAEYINRLYPEAKVLWHGVSTTIGLDMEWQASVSWLENKGD